MLHFTSVIYYDLFRKVSASSAVVRRYKGLIQRPVFHGEMRKISHEMNYPMPSKKKLGFSRKNFASPVSTYQAILLTSKAKRVGKFNRITHVQPFVIRRQNFSESGLKAFVYVYHALGDGFDHALSLFENFLTFL